MVLEPILQPLPVHFFGSRPQYPTSHWRMRLNDTPNAICCTFSTVSTISTADSQQSAPSWFFGTQFPWGNRGFVGGFQKTTLVLKIFNKKYDGQTSRQSSLLKFWICTRTFLRGVVAARAEFFSQKSQFMFCSHVLSSEVWLQRKQRQFFPKSLPCSLFMQFIRNLIYESFHARGGSSDGSTAHQNSQKSHLYSFYTVHLVVIWHFRIFAQGSVATRFPRPRVSKVTS